VGTKKNYKKTSDRTDAQRADRLYAAVDQFEYGSELAKRVYHLGTPRFTDFCSTASLTITQDEPVFEFNRAYFDGLGHDEMVFVILHETVHFAFCHSVRRHDRLPALWNIACDLVVNTFLLQKVGFAKIISKSFRNFIKSAITFENLPIAPANKQLSLTAEQVYDLLVNDTKAVQGNASKNPKGRVQRATPVGKCGLTQRASNEARQVETGATGSGRRVSTIKACDEHGWSEADFDSTPEQSEPIGKLAEQAQQIFREWLPSWGDSSSGELRAIGGIIKPVNISWDFVLSRRIASCIQIAIEQRWAPPNRKIAWLYPAVLLPADREVERRHMSVLIAIDSSGSIPPPVLERLVAVAHSIPADRVQVTAVSFDAKVYPVDIWAKEPKVWGGGGTSFNAVEVFAKQLNKYPDLVVVLTDGLVPRPTVLHPDRWFWLITEQGTIKNIEGIGRHWVISSLVSHNETKKTTQLN
jgi:predicted metal-dependent peptidase